MGASGASAVSETLDVAVCQLTSTEDVDANLHQILSRLRRLEGERVDFVCFPENALYLRIREGERLPAIDLEHRAVREIARWAQATGAVVHLGSVPFESGGKLFNTSLLVRPDGGVQAHYDKIHLFDVDVAGHKPVRESDVFAPGEAPSIFSINGWKFGATICYDVRFAELFLEYARLGVDVLLIPASFLVPTGQAHWHVLTRARAIECQAYVLAAAQGGSHTRSDGAARQTYGHSLIVDPWGVVVDEVVDATAGRDVLRATLSKERIRQVRTQIPVSSHRRLR